MGFVSFVGRVFFASIFILSAWQMYNEFGSNGGPAAKEFEPKIAVFRKLLASKLGKDVPNIDVRQIIAASIFLKGFGGILFVLGSSLGAYFLMFYLLLTTPILYDFYNYDLDEPQFVQIFQEFLQSVALFGALLFLLGMRNCNLPRKQLKRKSPKSKTV